MGGGVGGASSSSALMVTGNNALLSVAMIYVLASVLNTFFRHSLAYGYLVLLLDFSDLFDFDLFLLLGRDCTGTKMSNTKKRSY